MDWPYRKTSLDVKGISGIIANSNNGKYAQSHIEHLYINIKTIDLIYSNSGFTFVLAKLEINESSIIKN
jgi:hypothetical protein